MKYLLTSTGLTNDSIAGALEKAVGKPLSDTSVLFIPTAANTEGGDKRWLIENLLQFTNYGVGSIDILDITAVPDELWKERFQEKDVICFGGGNEKYLADVLESLNMKEFLETLTDKVYMGISAGSMVTGVFMPEELYPMVFPEEDFGAITKDGMNLCNFCFIPHLNSTFFTHIRKENLDEVQDAFATTVYAVDDDTALLVEEGAVTIIGDGEYALLER